MRKAISLYALEVYWYSIFIYDRIRAMRKYNSTVNHCFRGNISRLIVCLAITIMSACSEDPAKVALTQGGDEAKCVAAVDRITDQETLAKIVLEAYWPRVKETAVEKLTRQDLLAKIVIQYALKSDKEFKKSGFSYITTPAIKKINDQELLAMIILEGKVNEVRKSAFRKISDQELLAKIALEGKGLLCVDAYDELLDSEPVRPGLLLQTTMRFNTDCDLMVRRLVQPDSLKIIAAEKEDRVFQNVYKLFSSLDNKTLRYAEKIDNEDHRIRIMAGLLPAVYFLSMKEIESELGKIVSIDTAWSRDSQMFYPTNGHGSSLKVGGEKFRCSIKLDKIRNPISCSWASFIEEGVQHISGFSTSFLGSGVNSGDLLKIAFKHLSPKTVKKVATEGLDGLTRGSSRNDYFFELAEQELARRAN